MTKTKFSLHDLTSQQKAYRKRILEMSHHHKTSHIGSCFCAIDIISAIYMVKKKHEKFVLSAGHAGFALYAVLEKYGLLKKNDHQKLHIHPDRNEKKGLYVSSGSLGQGLAIAVGMALAQRKKQIFCMISDGECSEGSIWEAIRIASEQQLQNLKIIINSNGFGAYGTIDNKPLRNRCKAFGAYTSDLNGHDIMQLKTHLMMKTQNKPHVLLAQTTVAQLPFLTGLDAHYKIMSDEECRLGIRLLS